MMTMIGIPQGMRGTRCDTLVVTLALVLKGQEAEGRMGTVRCVGRQAGRQAGRQGDTQVGRQAGR